MKMNKRLDDLRTLMQTYNLAAYIIPNTDPHQSEYIAEHWRSMTWVSGFDGSAGTLAVTNEFAGVWTDTRYFLQAEEQLEGSGVSLMRLQVQGQPEYVNWLADNLPKGSEVGIDGKLFSIAQVATMRQIFEKKGIELVACDDLIKMIWKDRPAIPENPIFIHDIVYAGKSRTEKIADIRQKMDKKGVRFHLLTALDDIAWLLNIRGNDVTCNPVAICYALITPENVQLFINPKKIPINIAHELKVDKIELLGYSSIENALKGLPKGAVILLSKNQVSHWLRNAIPNETELEFGASIPHYAKAIKNDVEIDHFRKVMVKDGVAMVRFFKWLEENIGQTKISELSAANQLEAFRAEQADFVGNSFDAISGYKGHGAIIHYRVTPETDWEMDADGVYLIDSGGQYLDGTTDITRTVTLGNPNEKEKIAYTSVLKAHIAVAMAHFPEGATGRHLHAICKQHVWNQGLDYGHGTGHGVGFFLNVHEGPQRIGDGGGSSVPFQIGMVTSNEPGNYIEGAYGIRIENLIVTIPSKYEGYLTSETITLCPIDKNLIKKELLTEAELNWFNGYHYMVYDRLSPHLNVEEIAWLRDKTSVL
ncbi:MAG: Xaa-Pro aminopeptidase [Cognaticolwellia sp.]|jgi:Xaa-Pro aminopeptidase